MIHAYDKGYLDDAMRNLGEAFDYAVNVCKFEADEFADMFIVGGFAEQFGAGVPRYVSGISGTELVCEVIGRACQTYEIPEVAPAYDCSPEYWCGWILAYYQWYTGRSFKDIKRKISMCEILKLYPALHEASEEKFVDTLNKRIGRKKTLTQLQVLRKAAGYSQRNLSEKAGVSLRMIQQYEQRAKDINRAAGNKLLALAKTLGCRIEDLMEHSTDEVENTNN